MIYPDKKEFMKLAKKGNLIPVYTEIQADFDTPISAFTKIDDGKYSYLLESVEGGERIGRFSFMGSSPSLVFSSKGARVTIAEKGKNKSYTAKKDPIDEIKGLMSRYKFVKVKGLPRFCGGLVGYMGYDIVRFFESIPDKNKDELGVPDSVFMLTDTILIFDHVEHVIKVVSNSHVEGDPSRAYEEAVNKIKAIIKKLEAPIKIGPKKERAKTGIAVESNFSKADFENIVNKAKRYIEAGDIIQVVLSQRFSAKTSKDAFSVYRSLRSINPSPYMFYLKLGGTRLVGSSPEIMVRCEEGAVELRPIAGTRRRGNDDEEDRLLEKELLNDPKEKAEHIMLVDLGRNDVGRVCDFNSVKVGEFMVVEKYSHVMHIVSDVSGKLKKGKDVFDVVRASFPAGTVAGAPKIRAMEIIDELENLKRGPYAGSVGYFSFSGNLDSCITIRTILIKDNTAYVQAGAGIVADSKPDREYAETVNKARALIKAIESAE